MKAQLSQVHWGLVLKTGILLYILISILGLGLSLLLLAFLNWGHVEPHSAFQAFSWITALLVIGVTGYGASRVARKVECAAPLHGLLVGLVVALISLLLDLVLSGGIDPVGLLLSVAVVAAGWLGGVLGSRRREQS
jgi:putative membrane protein (TIGR04086 family)